MKTAISHYFLWVLALLIIQLSAEAQTSSPASPASSASSVSPPKKKKKQKPKEKATVAIDIDAGGAYPFNKDLNEIFKAGFNASVGIKRSFLRRKNLWVRPMAGIKFYSKKAELGQTMQETFRTWKAGLELQYKVKDFKKFSILPVVRVNNNWCSNQFSKRSEVGEGSNTMMVSGNFLDGTGISFGGGVMVVRAKTLYVKLDYEYFQPTLNVNPDLIKAMYADGILMPETRKIDCSTINLSVGVNLNFKK